MTPVNFQQLSNFIWSVADLVHGPYHPPQYERVMLPLTVLRRFDCVLAPSKQKAPAKYKRREGEDSQVVEWVLNSLAKGGDGCHQSRSAQKDGFMIEPTEVMMVCPRSRT